MSWVNRREAEQRLVDLCESYVAQIAAAYALRHQHPGQLQDWRDWSTRVGLVNDFEAATWRNAMVLRNHIVITREFSITLKDINRHAARLQPIVDALPARIQDLHPPAGSNVRYLR